jgi:L-alanine-DL-glutamate epimerase-like enolase superfamily enzyme
MPYVLKPYWSVVYDDYATTMSDIATTILSARVEFSDQPFIKPLVLSSGPIYSVTIAKTEVVVRVGQQEAIGHGSIALSDLWAWPEPTLSHDQRDQALRALCQKIANNLQMLCGGEPAHPIELGLRLHNSVCETPSHNAESTGPNPSLLAKAMCLSPFDAAVHDAVGHALKRSAFTFYEEDQLIPASDHLFAGSSTCAVIRSMLNTRPVEKFSAWVIVGKGDDLNSDILPWVNDRQYGCFKLKLQGTDNTEDVRRVIEVYRAAKAWGLKHVRISVDSNEANPDADSVLEFLLRLRGEDVGAFNALEYLEQPTGRDITRDRYDWQAVTKLKPVLLDEGLTSLDLLPLAVEQGWSGLALKTCKGHSFALVAAAWAHRRGMMLAMQDLTNTGWSAIHAALFAAYVPTINGVELNSPQFMPLANEPWLPRLTALFEPCNGIHHIPDVKSYGLGSEI